MEQHGPHLPTGTDIFAANAIAEAVAERMDGLILPGGPLGVTPLHMGYEGTLTLSHETYIRVVKETAASAAQHGARQLLLLNWHEGNIPALAIAAESLHLDHRHDRSGPCKLVMWLRRCLALHVRGLRMEGKSRALAVSGRET